MQWSNFRGPLYNYWKGAKLPVLFVRDLMDTVIHISENQSTLCSTLDSIFGTRMWDETNAQKDNTIQRFTSFPENLTAMIYSGPHFYIANPLFKTPRRKCKLNSDYDSIDLHAIGASYIQRSNFQPVCSAEDYDRRISITKWKTKSNTDYRLATRAMVDPIGSRSLISAIIPPLCGHVNAVFTMSFENYDLLLDTAAMFASLPADFLVKTSGKSAFLMDSAEKLPYLHGKQYYSARVRIALLNCITSNYSKLWDNVFSSESPIYGWSKKDSRLDPKVYENIDQKWNDCVGLKSDYARHQALLEIDVITAIQLNMTLAELLSIYHIQFSTLQSHELNTWYDTNGRIVFTNNRSLTGVGFTRPEFEAANAVVPVQRGSAPWNGIMKDAPEGYVFERTINDDTMPGGPIQRTIQYVAPFDRCDREQDYETAWKFFEEKYGKD